jgi:hypothetical protein
MEQAQPQPEQAQQPADVAGKKKTSTWWIVGGVGCAILLLFACVAAIAAYVVSNNLVNTISKSDTAAAQVVLRNAVSDAAQFAANNDNSFDGMAAGDLTNIDSSINWVDGDPGAGEVGIINAGADTYTLTYKDDTGTAYQAVRESNGNIKYTDANGKTL